VLLQPVVEKAVVFQAVLPQRGPAPVHLVALGARELELILWWNTSREK
jgi:hypothetical protein